VLDQPWELVVVDNGSTDESRSIAAARSPELPSLRIVDDPRAGLNRARNRGVRAARAPRLLCCDADDEVEPGWLQAMTDGLARFDLVGGALRARPDLAAAARSLHVPQTDALPTLFGHAYSVGANLGFRRTVWDAIGGFDEGFDTGADDIEFCLRAARAGFSIGFVPDGVTRYTLQETAGALVRQRFRYGRGHQRLVARGAREGWIDETVGQRWRGIATRSVKLVATSPQLLRDQQRLPYLVRLAHVAGEATELVRRARLGG
jgi:GT2 family glycosyltransferase